MNNTIIKAAGIIIQDRKLLLTKPFSKEFYVSPGGKVEGEETLEQALVRELQEEVNIIVKEEDLELLLVSSAPAAGNEEFIVEISAFIVPQYEGEVLPSNEIEDVEWVNSSIPEGMKVGSIFEHDVIPKLKKMDLID